MKSLFVLNPKRGNKTASVLKIADASGSALVRAEIGRVRVACESQIIIARDAITLALEGLKS